MTEEEVRPCVGGTSLIVKERFEVICLISKICLISTFPDFLPLPKPIEVDIYPGETNLSGCSKDVGDISGKQV